MKVCLLFLKHLHIFHDQPGIACSIISKCLINQFNNYLRFVNQGNYWRFWERKKWFLNICITICCCCLYIKWGAITTKKAYRLEIFGRTENTHPTRKVSYFHSYKNTYTYICTYIWLTLPPSQGTWPFLSLWFDFSTFYTLLKLKNESMIILYVYVDMYEDE